MACSSQHSAFSKRPAKPGLFCLLREDALGILAARRHAVAERVNFGRARANATIDRVSEIMIDRTAAWSLLTEFTQSESLRKHALAVEACMRAYARKLGADEELWGTVGLIHDFDYEKYPSLEDHPYRGNEILKERGYSDEIRRAIMSHAEYTGVTRDSPMEKTLFACDELAGFITAVALVKPGKSLSEVDAKSVRKKMKDKAFARSVNRDDIVNGARDLGVELEEHIAFSIEALKGIAGELGLGT